MELKTVRRPRQQYSLNVLLIFLASQAVICNCNEVIEMAMFLAREFKAEVVSFVLHMGHVSDKDQLNLMLMLRSSRLLASTTVEGDVHKVMYVLQGCGYNNTEIVADILAFGATDSTFMVVTPNNIDVDGLNLRLDSQIYTYSCPADNEDFIEVNEVYAVKNGPRIKGAIGTWHSNSSKFTPATVQSLWERRTDLQGAHVTSSNLEYRPIMYVAEDKVTVSGLFPDMMSLMAKELNFTFKSQVPRDGNQWGIMDKNGEWNGLIGELVRGEIDVCISGLFLSGQRRVATDWTLEVRKGLITLQIKDTEDRQMLNLNVYFDALTEEAWILLFSTAALVVLTLVITSKSRVDKGLLNFGLLQAISFVGMAMMQREFQMHRTTSTAKTLFLVTCLFGFLFFASYSAVMTSTMIARPVEPELKNFQQLLDQNYIVGVWGSTVPHDFLRLAPEGTPQQKAYEELVEAHEGTIYSTIPEAVENFDKFDARYAAYEADLTFFGIPNIKLLRDFEDFSYTTIAWGLAKGSEFRLLFNYHLLKIAQSGITRKLETKWRLREPEQLDLDNNAGDASALGYDNLVFPVLALLGGMGVSVVLAVMERTPCCTSFGSH